MIITGRNVNLSLSFSPRVVGQFLPKIPIIFWIEHIVPLRAVAQVVIAVYQLVLFNIFLIHPMMVHKKGLRAKDFASMPDQGVCEPLPSVVTRNKSLSIFFFDKRSPLKLINPIAGG